MISRKKSIKKSHVFLFLSNFQIFPRSYILHEETTTSTLLCLTHFIWTLTENKYPPVETKKEALKKYTHTPHYTKCNLLSFRVKIHENNFEEEKSAIIPTT